MCAVADWPVCLIVRGDLSRYGRMRTFAYLRDSPVIDTSEPVSLHFPLFSSHLIEDHRISRNRLKINQRLAYEYHMIVNICYCLPIIEIGHFSGVESFSPKSLWLLVKCRRIRSGSRCLHNFATICILIAKHMRRRIFENRFSLFTHILIYTSLIIEDLRVFLYQVLLCEGNKKRLHFSLYTVNDQDGCAIREWLKLNINSTACLRFRQAT